MVYDEDDDDDEEIELDGASLDDIFDQLAINPIGLSSKMNDEIYFGKIICNALENWTGSYSDQASLKSVVEHSDAYHGVWVKHYNDTKEAAMDAEEKANGYRSAFVNMDKYLSKEDVLGYVEEIRQIHPQITQPFEISDSVRIISELLDISETEMILLETAMRLHNGIDYDIYRTLNTIGQMDSLKDRAVNLSVLYGVSKEEGLKASKGFLIETGILTEKNGPIGFYQCNNDIAAAFSMKGLTAESLEEKLFPSSITTDLLLDDYPHISKQISRAAKAVQHALDEDQAGMNILLWGEPGTGKSELALALAKEHGWDLKIVGDISAADNNEKGRAARIASLKLGTKLFAKNKKAVILFDEFEDLFKTDNSAAFSKAFINRIIETSPVPIIWTTNVLQVMDQAILRRMVYNINLSVPPTDTRALIWKKYSEQHGLEMGEKMIEKLADTFAIAPALISNAARVAKAALSEDERKDEESIVEIVSSLDQLVNYGVKRDLPKARSEEATYDPTCSNTDVNLDHLTNQLLKSNPNFSLLLYGVSGSGKSEYGRYLANRLGKKVVYLKVSDLMSKWVGETEQNIAAAFAEAKEGKKVLIMDEADAFLRDRSKAERSWEVTEVNQMLQEMEAHPEPFIMTTNLKDDIDPAAMRRFTFKMQFKHMRSEQIAKLYKTFFGYEATSRITACNLLVPSDFANVAKRARILNIDFKDNAIVEKMLLDEVGDRGDRYVTMGF